LFISICYVVRRWNEKEREPRVDGCRGASSHVRAEATPPHRFVLARTIETKMVICPIHVDVFRITTNFEDHERVNVTNYVVERHWKL
jgi:hypothetical protein